MTCSLNKYGYILVLLCELTNLPKAVLLKASKAVDLCKSIMNGLMKLFDTPTYIICDQDPALCQDWQFGIDIITVSVTSYKALLAEHNIQSLSNPLIKYLSG